MAAAVPGYLVPDVIKNFVLYFHRQIIEQVVYKVAHNYVFHWLKIYVCHRCEWEVSFLCICIVLMDKKPMVHGDHPLN